MRLLERISRTLLLYNICNKYTYLCVTNNVQLFLRIILCDYRLLHCTAAPNTCSPRAKTVILFLYMCVPAELLRLLPTWRWYGAKRNSHGFDFNLRIDTLCTRRVVRALGASETQTHTHTRHHIHM